MKFLVNKQKMKSTPEKSDPTLKTVEQYLKKKKTIAPSIIETFSLTKNTDASNLPPLKNPTKQVRQKQFRHPERNPKKIACCQAKNTNLNANLKQIHGF